MASWRLYILFKQELTHIKFNRRFRFWPSFLWILSCAAFLYARSLPRESTSPLKVASFWGFCMQQWYVRYYKFHSLRLMASNLGSLYVHIARIGLRYFQFSYSAFVADVQWAPKAWGVWRLIKVLHSGMIPAVAGVQILFTIWSPLQKGQPLFL